MQGEFSCQARNLAGLGNKCDVKVKIKKMSKIIKQWNEIESTPFYGNSLLPKNISSFIQLNDFSYIFLFLCWHQECVFELTIASTHFVY